MEKWWRNRKQSVLLLAPVLAAGEYGAEAEEGGRRYVEYRIELDAAAVGEVAVLLQRRFRRRVISLLLLRMRTVRRIAFHETLLLVARSRRALAAGGGSRGVASRQERQRAESPAVAAAAVQARAALESPERFLLLVRF